MKYSQAEFDQELNVTKLNPIKEFLSYSLGVILALALGYFILGALIDVSISHITPEKEKWLWKQVPISLFSPKGSLNDQQKKLQDYLQDLINRIPQSSLDFPLSPQIHLVKDDNPNAFAVPGGKIFVTTELVERVKSENALAFVLGHELGHFMSRDQLRQLGRGIVLIAISAFAFGDDSNVSEIITSLFTPIRNKFSQQQELRADLWGLRLNNSLYGHVGGTTEFFEELLKEHQENRLLDSFHTHPLNRDRIENIKQTIATLNLKVGQTTALPNW